MWLSAAGHVPQVHKQLGKVCRQQHMSLCRLGQAMHVHLNANPEVWQACRQPPLALVLLLRGKFKVITVLGQTGQLSISGLTLQLQVACKQGCA